MVQIFLKKCLLLGLLVNLSACGHLFYWPEEGLRGTPDQLGMPYQDVYITNDQGLRLHGWWLEARLDKGQTEQGVIYLLHGNAENISTHFFGMSWITKKGWHLFILDYRGFGLSQGKPSIAGVHDDAHQGLRWALQEAESRGLPLVVMGQSIGGTTALTLMALAKEAQQVEALVIDSAFSGYRRIAREKLSESWLLWSFQYPLSWLVTDRYSPEKHLDKLPEHPLLILHSCQDPVIPCSHGQRLYQGASEPKDYWQGDQAGHIRMLTQLNWQRKLLQWLNLTSSSR